MSARAEVEIAANADECYRRFCAVERVDEWVPGIAEIAVLETDGAGRATRVRYGGMPARGSLSYELRYDYDDASLTVRWRTVDVALRDLSGEARFTAIEGGRCRLSYGTTNATSEDLPAWARAVLDEESPQKVAFAFRRWLER